MVAVESDERIVGFARAMSDEAFAVYIADILAVPYTHLRAHDTGRNTVCRLLPAQKKPPDYVSSHYVPQP